MNKVNYQKAKRYLTKCGYEADFAHDAYILWFEKTGKDLFDEPNGTVIRVIKNVMGNAWGKKRYMWRGNTYPKVYIDVELITQPVAEQLVDIELYKQMLPITYQDIFEMLVMGYSCIDIAKQRNVTSTWIYHYRNQIKKILSS